MTDLMDDYHETSTRKVANQLNVSTKTARFILTTQLVYPF